MKNRMFYYTAWWAVLFILFQVVAFVSGGVTGLIASPSFWIGWTLITLALVGLLACAYTAFKADKLQNLFYRLSILQVGQTAVTVSAIVGAAAMLLGGPFVWIGVIVCFLVLAVNAMAIVKATAAAEAVEEIDEKIAAKTSFTKNLTLNAQTILGNAKSDEVKAECRKVYEAVRYSDPVSSDALTLTEAQITVRMSDLAAAVGADDAQKAKEIADEIVSLVGERNAKCKAMKG